MGGGRIIAPGGEAPQSRLAPPARDRTRIGLDGREGCISNEDACRGDPKEDLRPAMLASI